MTTIYHSPIVSGESNSPDTINTRLSTLDAAIAEKFGTLDDRLDDLIIDSGTSDAETIAARTAIRYGTAPSTLGNALELAAGNIIYVDAYGAAGDGVTDDDVPLQAAFTAAGAGDTVMFSPGKTYVSNTSLTMAADNVTITGYGATIDSSALDDEAIVITGDDCTVAGLNFIGPTSTGLGVNDIGSSRGILTVGERTMIRDCRLVGFLRGGIVVQGNYATVQGCHLKDVRNQGSVGAHYGSIHAAAVDWLVITNNIVTGVQHSGIGLFDCNDCVISANYVEGADWTVETAATPSMGMNFVGGVNRCAITGNVIRRIANEGIILSTGTAGVTSSNNTISNNVLIDCDLRGINIRAIGGTVGTPHYCDSNVISGNSVIARDIPGGGTMGHAYMIECNGTYDFARDNVIVGNTARGESSLLERGYQSVGPNCTGLSMTGNVFAEMTGTAVTHNGADSLIANNVMNGCSRGISVQSTMTESIISNNKIYNTVTTSIALSGAMSSTQIMNNQIDRPIDDSAATGSSYWLEGNVQDSIATHGIDTLVAGAVTITGTIFGADYSDAVVELYRLTAASTPANTGALYLRNKNQGGNAITVNSTNALDDGTFYWRVVR